MGILFFPLAAVLPAQQEVDPELAPIRTPPAKSAAVDGKVVEPQPKWLLLGPVSSSVTTPLPSVSSL